MGGMGDSNAEMWVNYPVYDYLLPSEEELKHMQAIIIPGSKNSVLDESVSWIPLLTRFVQKVYEEYPHVKIIGICFGC